MGNALQMRTTHHQAIIGLIFQVNIVLHQREALKKEQRENRMAWSRVEQATSAERLLTSTLFADALPSRY
jgi:hypothetical protein